ncbi:MAG TPA: metallophosphoesterase [Polyangiales bacterium]|nr:metallophosphoesterase [Polyangiales bacterium]
MSTFTLASWLAYLTVVLVAGRYRGRGAAIFTGIALGIFTLVSTTAPRSGNWVGYVRDYLQVAVYVHFLVFLWPRLRPLAWRLLVSIPASYYAAGTVLAWPVAIAVSFGASTDWFYLPYGFALLGLAESLWTPETVRDLVLDDLDAGAMRRYPLGKSNGHGAPQVLQLVQITDPHLGPFMSVRRLRKVCERAVERSPDLICLTGDFLTVESNHSPAALEAAFEPLSRAQGKVFACLGNHDHEAPHVVRRALSKAGVRLLVDEATEIDTPIGRVQLLGFDFHFRDREQRMAAVCERFPKPNGALRIVLLHDPGAFRKLPPGEGDLVLSGHTHGGQVGLVSFGLPWTLVSLVAKMPDHGLWARGKDRLYVHRGTGHYGFPLRVGVPAEQSLLRVQRGIDATISRNA